VDGAVWRGSGRVVRVRVRVEGRRFPCTAHPACRQVREQTTLRERPRGESAVANTEVGRVTVLFGQESDEYTQQAGEKVMASRRM
jgi:hypothetical protein